MKTFDAIVLGVGGMGSATCYHLAKRGASVLGIEQFGPVHALGSSHGYTRLIRKAYFESAAYVPLLHRSYELWDEIARTVHAHLFRRSGLLIMGPAKGGIAIEGMLATAKTHAIPLEILTSKQVKDRHPYFNPPDDYMGVNEPDAGYLFVEKCVETYLRASEALGAELHFEEPALEFIVDNDHSVRVKTPKGTYGASKLVITAGPWSARVLASLGLPLTVRRAPQFWFEASPDFLTAPCFAFDNTDGFIYGFPNFPGWGMKMAEYEPKETVLDPSSVNRDLNESDLVRTQKTIRQFLKGVSPSPIKHSTCLYTLTPDEDFILDIHPQFKNISLAAGFSGHGFKFASVVGECMADLALHGETSLPIEFLRLKRLIGRSSSPARAPRVT